MGCRILPDIARIRIQPFRKNRTRIPRFFFTRAEESRKKTGYGSRITTPFVWELPQARDEITKGWMQNDMIKSKANVNISDKFVPFQCYLICVNSRETRHTEDYWSTLRFFLKINHILTISQFFVKKLSLFVFAFNRTRSLQKGL